MPATRSLPGPRGGVAEALRAGPVWFVARGRPGLGRVTETISLSLQLADWGGHPRIRLHTSPQALEFARSILGQGVKAFDLGGGPDLQQAFIDTEPLHRLLEQTSRLRPAAVVVNGFPLCLPLLRWSGDARIVAMANLHDIDNPRHTRGARLLQQALHGAADLVLVGELRRGWRRTRLDSLPVLRIPSLVRADARDSGLGPLPGAEVVAVVGGGSHGDPEMERSTRAILGALDRAVLSGTLPSCVVFGGSELPLLGSHYPHLSMAEDPGESLRVMARAELVIARGGRGTLAEILASRRRAVVIAAESATLRGAEQASNIAAAARLSPAVVPLAISSLAELARACRLAAAARPARWAPGNEILEAALSGL